MRTDLKSNPATAIFHKPKGQERVYSVVTNITRAHNHAHLSLQLHQLSLQLVHPSLIKRLQRGLMLNLHG